MKVSYYVTRPLKWALNVVHERHQSPKRSCWLFKTNKKREKFFNFTHLSVTLHSYIFFLSFLYLYVYKNYLEIISWALYSNKLILEDTQFFFHVTLKPLSDGYFLQCLRTSLTKYLLEYADRYVHKREKKTIILYQE